MTRRRAGARSVVATLVAALVLAGLAACTDGGSTEDFCERLPEIPDVASILAELDSSDPGGVETRIEDGIAEFRALEADAPGEIRDDIARLRQGVELVLEAVQDNTGDLAGARDDILARSDELSGLLQAGERVVAYAEAECDVELEPGG